MYRINETLTAAVGFGPQLHCVANYNLYKYIAQIKLMKMLKSLRACSQ